jgi:predicted transcriptional regulator
MFSIDSTEKTGIYLNSLYIVLGECAMENGVLQRSLWFYSPLHKKYRSHFEIVALILDAAKNEFAGRYSLMKQAGLNYTQLKKYLEPLSEIGLISKHINEGKIVYRDSEKGLAILRQYCLLLEMLMEAQLTGINKNNDPNNLQQILERWR